MATLPPFNMFEREGITESVVKECAVLFQQIVNNTMDYIVSVETSNSALVQGIYSRIIASMLAVVEDLNRMHDFMHEQYNIYMNEQNRKVKELIGPRGVMDCYEEHQDKLAECVASINSHIEVCKIRINEAVGFDYLTSKLYCKYKDIMYSLMKEFSTRFKTYFDLILAFHARKNLKIDVRHLERKKNMYNVQMEKFKTIVEKQECQNEVEALLTAVEQKKQQLSDLRKEILLKKNDVTELAGYKREIDRLEISLMLEKCKTEQGLWRSGVDAHCKSLKRIANSCYEFEVTTEAVWFNKRVDLTKIRVLGLSESIKRRIVWVNDLFSSLVSKSLLLKKERDDTLNTKVD